MAGEPILEPPVSRLGVPRSQLLGSALDEGEAESTYATIEGMSPSDFVAGVEATSSTEQARGQDRDRGMGGTRRGTRATLGAADSMESSADSVASSAPIPLRMAFRAPLAEMGRC